MSQSISREHPGGYLTLVLGSIPKKPGPQRTSLGKKDLLQSRGMVTPPTNFAMRPVTLDHWRA